MALVYRVYVAYSDDDGDIWSGMDEISTPGATGDQSVPTTREQAYHDYEADRFLDVCWTSADVAVYFNKAKMPPSPLNVKINKLNRHRTIGNEL